jgi:hypothetical protein
VASDPAPDEARRPDLAALAREVRAVRKRLAEHEREHERADRAREHAALERDRQRRATRRYWITTIVVVLSSNLATVLILASVGHA